jgi:hypothetical protein
VSGHIKNASGVPISGARLTLLGTSVQAASHKTQTDAGGTYSFTVPQGSYSLSVQAAGYAPPVNDELTLWPGLTNSNGCNAVFDAALVPQASIPKPDATTLAYENAVHAYCKKVGQGAACAYYTTHAVRCLTSIDFATNVYTHVALLVKTGYSSAQAVEGAVEGEAGDSISSLSMDDAATIAQYAATRPDVRKGIVDPAPGRAFARTVLFPACMRRITQ